MRRIITGRIGVANRSTVRLITILTLTSIFSYLQWHCPEQSFAGPLLHNSANLGTKYGAWGATFDCSTCHARGSSNVKRVAQAVTTPTGQRNVVFLRMTASSASIPGVFGDDQRSYAQNGSTNICEVCHHKTVYHQYSASKITAQNNSHGNRRDCVTCHNHDTGFKASGHNVPYYGSVHNSAAGASPFSSCTGCHTNTKNASYPYPQAVGVAPDCQNCHTKSSPVGNTTSGCYSCHGASGATGTNIGRPATANTTSFPDRRGQHARGEHNVACTTCHAWGTGSTKHGWSNRKKSFSSYSAVKQKITIWSVPTPGSGTRSTSSGTCSGTPSSGCGTHGSSCYWY